MSIFTQGLNLGTQASLRVAWNRRTLYIDPFQIRAAGKADAILITHPHFDHFDPASIRRLYQPGCTVCVPHGSEEIYSIVAREDVRSVVPGQGLDLNGIGIRTVPAYNVHPERLHFHPKENRWVGYVISVGDRTIYHAGDTDRISEMQSLRGTVTVAFLPIGGTYTMDASEAGEAVADISPQVACPMHLIPAGDRKAQLDAQQRFKQQARQYCMVETLNGKGAFG